MTISFKYLPAISQETLLCIVREPTFYFTINRNTVRSEEHTSELQSQSNLLCRLVLFFKGPGDPRDLPSSPTRRSSDLPAISQETLLCIVREPTFYFTINRNTV